MGRRVKLQDLGEYGNSDTAYRAENKKYYSSEDAYLRIKTNSEYRKMCISQLYDLLGYHDKMRLPTLTYQRLSELEALGFDTVSYCITKRSDAITWALKNKNFGGETAKIMYIFAIINNHIMEDRKDYLSEQKAKKIMDDMQVDDGNDQNINRVSKKTRDISKWLD